MSLFPNPCTVCGADDEHEAWRQQAFATPGMQYSATICPHPAEPGHGSGCCCMGRSEYPFAMPFQLFKEKDRNDTGNLRTFSTGATRDTAQDKHEPWGFTSALAEKRFCEYMHKHRKQSDGNLRDSDNWKKGIDLDSYRHSLSRHIQDLRLIFEGYASEAGQADLEEVLCAVLFNVQGLLHETVKARTASVPPLPPA